MAYIEDLSQCKYFQHPAMGAAIAVGWLEGGYPFTQGEVPPNFLQRLKEHFENCWQPFIMLGPHICSLPHALDEPEFCGHRNLIVPSSIGAIVCPELIIHYIESHKYRPPEIFENAVISCPRVGSRAYFIALETCGFDWDGASSMPRHAWEHNAQMLGMSLADYETMQIKLSQERRREYLSE